MEFLMEGAELKPTTADGYSITFVDDPTHVYLMAMMAANQRQIAKGMHRTQGKAAYILRNRLRGYASCEVRALELPLPTLVVCTGVAYSHTEYVILQDWGAPPRAYWRLSAHRLWLPAIRRHDTPREFPQEHATSLVAFALQTTLAGDFLQQDGDGS